MRVFLLTLSLSWALSLPPAAGAQPDTLRLGIGDAIARALSRSPDVLAKESAASFASARLDLARASRFLTGFTATSAHAVAPSLYNPNGTAQDRLYLDPDVRNDWNDLSPFNRLDIEALQPLYTWGEVGRSIDAARFGLVVDQEAVREQKLRVAVRSGELYFGLVLAQALERLTDQAADIVERAKTEIRNLLDEGDDGVDDADLFQVLITEQEFERRVVEVAQRLRTVRTGLRLQLMLPENLVPQPVEDVLEPLALPVDLLEVYLQAALTERPEPARAVAGVEARRALVDVARSAYYPKLFLGVEARYSGADGRFRQDNPFVGDPFLSRSVRAGLGFRMELNFFQTRARVEQARAQLQETMHQAEGARQLVRYEVEAAFRELQVRRAGLTAAEEALRLSKEWLRTEEINFDYDLGDTENLVDAVRANLELQASRHQAVFDFNMAVLKLLAAAGLLDRLTEFGMQLE